MKQRGRKSAASMGLVSADQRQRPEPDPGLSQAEADVWRRVVDDLPLDWFRESNLAVLTGYCRTAVNCDRIAALIADHGDSEDIVSYDRLLKMQETQHRALLSFATKMRLTQQATYDKEKRKPSSSVKKPWE